VSCSYKDVVDWSTARSRCQAMNAELVSIGDDDENQFVYNISYVMAPSRQPSPPSKRSEKKMLKAKFHYAS